MRLLHALVGRVVDRFPSLGGILPGDQLDEGNAPWGQRVRRGSERYAERALVAAVKA